MVHVTMAPVNLVNHTTEAVATMDTSNCGFRKFWRFADYHVVEADPLWSTTVKVPLLQEEAGTLSVAVIVPDDDDGT